MFDEVKELKLKENTTVGTLLKTFEKTLKTVVKKEIKKAETVRLKPVALKVGFMTQISTENGTKDMYITISLVSVKERNFKEQYEIEALVCQNDKNQKEEENDECKSNCCN